jgi:hypothetical protein
MQGDDEHEQELLAPPEPYCVGPPPTEYCLKKFRTDPEYVERFALIRNKGRNNGDEERGLPPTRYYNRRVRNQIIQVCHDGSEVMCYLNGDDPFTAKGLKLDPKPSDLPGVLRSAYRALIIGDHSTVDHDGTPRLDSSNKPKHVFSVEQGRKFNPSHNKQHCIAFFKSFIMGQKNINAAVEKDWCSGFETIRKSNRYVGGAYRGKPDDWLPFEFTRRAPDNTAASTIAQAPTVPTIPAASTFRRASAAPTKARNFTKKQLQVNRAPAAPTKQRHANLFLLGANQQQTLAVEHERNLAAARLEIVRLREQAKKDAHQAQMEKQVR